MMTDALNTVLAISLFAEQNAMWFSAMIACFSLELYKIHDRSTVIQNSLLPRATPGTADPYQEQHAYPLRALCMKVNYQPP